MECGQAFLQDGFPTFTSEEQLNLEQRIEARFYGNLKQTPEILNKLSVYMPFVEKRSPQFLLLVRSSFEKVTSSI